MTATDAADPTATTDGAPRRRRPGRALALVAAFAAGASLSGAGAAWAGHQFSDVPNSNQFHDDIDWMVDQGITEGYDDGTFRPTAPVSRQAFAAFLHRYNAETELVQVVNDPNPGSTFAQVVNCPPGKRVVGGGGSLDYPGVYMTSSYPYGDDAWYVAWKTIEFESTNPNNRQAYAICVPEP